MPVKGGKLVLTGSGDQTVTVGFSPDLILLFHNNFGIEDAWQSSGGVLGMGVVSRNNTTQGSTDNAPHSTGVNELWVSNEASSYYTFDVAVFMRTSVGGGPALYGIQIDADSFTLRYSGGGFTGGAGWPIYWLAFGEEEDMEVKQGYFGVTPSPNSLITGFTPNVLFGLLMGSTNSNPTQSVGFTNFSVPSWTIGALVNDEPGYVNLMNLSHAQSSTSVQNYSIGQLNNYSMYADAIMVSLGFETAAFYFSTATDRVNFVHAAGGPSGFLAEYGRMSIYAMSGINAITGGVTPSATIGGEVQVDLPFDAEAVVFFCPNPFSDGFVPDSYAGSAFGFVDSSGFQAVTAAGGHHQTEMTKFQSSSLAWVSNFTDGSMGVNALQGTAEITPGGFKVTTTSGTKSPFYLMYTAFGFEQPAPGFFRVVHR